MNKKPKPQKRGEFVPLGDMAGAVELPGGRVLSPATPQARHHFTTLHQVNQLVEAGEAEPDLGFMARLLALCSLAAHQPENRLQYIRRNGPYTLGCKRGDQHGSLWATCRVYSWRGSAPKRYGRNTASSSSAGRLYEFMRKLGIEDRSGGLHGERTRLKNQMRGSLAAAYSSSTATPP